MDGGEILAAREVMTISREEFLRSLPAAVNHVAYEVDRSEVRYAGNGRQWRIVLTPLAPLRVGALRLPRQRVEIFVAGFSEPELRQFLARFELHFRRGGG